MAIHPLGVFLRRANDSEAPQYLEVEAGTRHMAAREAEISRPGWTAYAVTTRWELAGRCEISRAFLFADERSRKSRSGLRQIGINPSPEWKLEREFLDTHNDKGLKPLADELGVDITAALPFNFGKTEFSNTF